MQDQIIILASLWNHVSIDFNGFFSITTVQLVSSVSNIHYQVIDGSNPNLLQPNGHFFRSYSDTSKPVSDTYENDIIR